MPDRHVRRSWSLDLSSAGKAPAPAVPRSDGASQSIVSFEARDGDEERFSIWMTFPDDESVLEEPPTQKQYDAVAAFYGEGPTNRDQAGYLMSAWYFADEIRSTRNFGFTAPRRALIHAATAAYLLGEPELRISVRNWTSIAGARRSRPGASKRRRPGSRPCASRTT